MDLSGSPKKPGRPDSWLRYSSLAIQMLVTIGFAAWAGYLLDQKFGFTFPVFLLTFIMLAFGGVLYRLWISVTRDE